ncbi:CoA-disulfide reductase [Paenibacillus sp. N1-5-1-14]|uniref:CoA-disulfide reductase n=1 Tax=Paenibacillus radicibacter TaxID=2972488 RepID=UPI00215979A3|nr:CoA-disulfide reductase [Paenibacillus radicibacter]MCR8642705.1 CoA-disulfide reductase [Paenibacillus radicibacter]
MNKIVIVGGVAGGATTAARLRRLNEQNQIIMFERGEYISFANCGLPYYIGGSITDRKKLLVQTVGGMSKRFGLDIRNLSEVTRINRDRKTVTVTNLSTNEEYEESYDVLVLSPGAKPIVPDLPGIADAKDLFTLRNIPDTDRIKSHIDNNKPKRAVVIGGGFIGVEMVENLVEQGIHVTLVEMGKQVMAPIDYEMACIVQEHMRAKGVDILLEDGVQSFENNGKLVKLSSGRELAADMIILAIGVQPENKLAKDAGLELGLRGAIKVNSSLLTNDPSIYAIGDAIEVMDLVNGQPTVVPLAWGANRQGHIVADRINGRDVKYNGVLGTSIAKVFDLTVAATGNNEKTLQRVGASYEVIHVHPSSHASYYPGAAAISLKLIFEKESGRILGAQAVSFDGADKRIDVIATAMRGGLTVTELPELELAYAPPYSSAKDPVNMAGYVATNIVEGLVDTVQWHEIDEIVREGGLLIDVRDAIEREMGYIAGSINIPLNDLRERMAEVPKDQIVYVSCQVGLRGYLAARVLMEHGYQVKNLDGGYRTYASVYREQEAQSKVSTGNGQSQGGTTVASEVKQVDQKPDQIETQATSVEASVTIDACGLQCPGPILQVYNTVEKMKAGEVLEVKATDPGFAADIKKWCEKRGHQLLDSSVQNNTVHARIRKGGGAEVNGVNAVAAAPANTKNGATLVVFSGDLDKAIASFIIALGSVSMGKKVTMFFTFWGLNILRKADAPKVDKDIVEKMFGIMMPKGVGNLPMSKMNMAGMGPKMIEHAMQRKNVDSLATLMHKAQESGVKFVACTMSMDIMGMKQEELLDGIEYGGVASYLGDAEDAGLNLFI